MARLTRDELIERVAHAIRTLRHNTYKSQAIAAIETYEELTLPRPFSFIASDLEWQQKQVDEWKKDHPEEAKRMEAYGAEARNRLLRGLHGSVPDATLSIRKEPT